MEANVVCQHCHTNQVGPRRRIYCDSCGPRASAIWKARNRPQMAELWRRDGKKGSPPWLDHWPSHDARKAYFRDYMRTWRSRRRAAAKAGPPADIPPGRVSRAGELDR